MDLAAPFRSHHVRYFARNLAAHRDPRNRAVHLVATVVGFCCLVSMLARVQLGAAGLDLGAVLAIATVLYVAPFEPLAAAVVGAAVLIERLVLGAHFGQVGVGPLVGLGVPLAVFLLFNLTGVATHFVFDDPIIASGSKEKLPVRLAKTAHTIAFSSVHFVGFALFALGYRPALHAQIVAAAEQQSIAWGKPTA
jgi:uncharacterized membrane protein YGL010W